MVHKHRPREHCRNASVSCTGHPVENKAVTQQSNYQLNAHPQLQASKIFFHCESFPAIDLGSRRWQSATRFMRRRYSGIKKHTRTFEYFDTMRCTISICSIVSRTLSFQELSPEHGTKMDQNCPPTCPLRNLGISLPIEKIGIFISEQYFTGMKYLG